jgi:site-specific recombinase XerD
MQWDDDKQAVPHALRHTFVSRLVQRGVPILSVKELAGHKTIDVTLKYAHLAPHNLKSAIDVLEPTEIVA